MKNYKLSISLGLVALMGISTLYQFSDRLESRKSYENDVAQAREQVETGLNEDAERSYLKALERWPNLALYKELGGFYVDRGETRSAAKLYRNVMRDKFPEDPETYLYGIDIYLKDGRVREAFEAYHEGKERCQNSEGLDEAIKPHWYDFTLSERFEGVRPYSRSCRLAAVCDSGIWYYVDENGRVAINGGFKEAGAFGQYAAVVDSEGNAFCIAQDGSKKITSAVIEKADPEFGKVQRFITPTGGILAAYNGKSWNFYDDESLELKCGGYTAATGFSSGVAAVSKDGNKWALISGDGTELTDYSFNGAVVDEKGVLCRGNGLFMKKGWDFQLVDTTGAPITDQTFEEVVAFNDNTLAAVKQGGSWKFINEAGELTDLGKFQEARSFSAGLAAVKQNDKWGYIDANGEVAIDFQFQEAQDFSDYGTAFVKVENTWRLLQLDRMNYD